MVNGESVFLLEVTSTPHFVSDANTLISHSRVS